MKKAALVLIAVLSLALLIQGCAKNRNPLEPKSTLLPDQARPTPTAVAPTQDKSTVVVKTVFGNTPLTNIAFNVQFVGQASPTTGITDPTGSAALIIDAGGNFVATIPAQNDILQTALSGYCNKGQVTNVIFNAGGAWTSITPTAISYGYSGGSFPIKIRYSKQAYALNVKVTPSLINLPAGWSAVFANQTLTSDQDSTMTITVPANQNVMSNNMMVRANAINNVFQINSNPISLTQGWHNYAYVKVVVKNGLVDYPGVNFGIIDSAGNTYNGVSQVGGATIYINNIGIYSVHIPAQGIVADNLQSGNVGQAETQTSTFNVGSCIVKMTVAHNSVGYSQIPVRITDSNGTIYNGTTDASGYYAFNLAAIGNYTAAVLNDSSDGILYSSKTSSVKQNESAQINFQGQPGSLAVNANYAYPYIGGTHQGTITYTPAGEIKYSLNLAANGFPAGGSVTGVFNNNTVDPSNTSRTITETVQSNVYTWSSSTLNVTATKPGKNTYAVTSNNFTITYGWTMSVSISTNPLSLLGKATLSVPYTVVTTGVPANTSINMTFGCLPSANYVSKKG